MRGIVGVPITVVVAALTALDADELAGAGERGEAQLRQTLRQLGGEKLLLRLDAPLVRIPKVDIQFTAVIHGNLPLLKPLAPAIRSLSGDKLFQSIHFGIRQFSGDAAFRHAPELPVTFLYDEDGGAHLAVNAVCFIIPMHDAALRLLRHPVFHQRRRDLILIAPQLTALQKCAAVIKFAVLVSLVEIGGQGHIQLEGGQLGRQHGEAVLAGDERQRAAIVPLHKNLPLIVHKVYFALRAGKNGMIRVLHRIEPDAGAGGILLLDKIHHFSVHHLIPPIVMPCLGVF